MNNDESTSPHYLHRTDKWPPAEIRLHKLEEMREYLVSNSWLPIDETDNWRTLDDHREDYKGMDTESAYWHQYKVNNNLIYEKTEWVKTTSQENLVKENIHSAYMRFRRNVQLTRGSS